MKHIIKLSGTATRTDVENQFKGTITFLNEEGDQVEFEYLSTDPKGKEINLKISGKGEEFSVKGLPSNELIGGLKDNQKWIFGFSMALLPELLINSEDMLLSHSTTQMMRMFKADASGSMNTSIEVEDGVGYQFIFAEEIAENTKLATLQSETGIPLRLLKKAKYSTFSEWRAGCTLEDAEEAYLSAPDEGKEPQDKTLLQIIKKILDLKLQVVV